MKKNQKIWIIVFTLFYSCSKSPNQITTIHALALNDTLKSRIIHINAEILHSKCLYNINNNFLVVIDDKPKNIFQVFNLPDLKYLYSWGNRGRGPNEFEPILFNKNKINIKGNQIILYNDIPPNLIFYTVTDTALIPTHTLSLHYESERQPLSIVRRINDSLYAISHILMTQNEFLALSPGKNKPLFAFGSYPETSLKGIKKVEEYSKGVISKPDGSKFIYYYLFHNEFKIYNNKGKLLKAINISDKYIKKNKKNIYRFSAYATNKYVYFFAVNTTGKNAYNKITFRPSIEIWNWQGKPINRFVLNKYVNRFTISEKYKKIYAISGYDTNHIYEFNIDKFLK
jgi:hypothetical protein